MSKQPGSKELTERAFTLRVPEKTYWRLREEAAKAQKRSINELLNVWIAERLKEIDEPRR